MGFFQAPLDEGSQNKAVMTFIHGSFAYRRMRFGLIKRSSTFHRLMDQLLVGTRW